MNVVKSYIDGWKSLWKYRWPITFLYFANIIFTYIVTSPYTVYFKDKMENSDVLEMHDGFDISMILEFINNHGAGLQPLMTLLLIVVLFYFLFGVYANSAILYAVISQNKLISLRPFWNGGLNYFWRLLRLSIYYILSLVLLGFVIWFILTLVGINILEVRTDDELSRKIFIALIGFGIFAALFSIIKQFAKLKIAVTNQPYISGAILKGGGFVMKNFVATSMLYVINLFVAVLFYLVYVNVRRAIDIDLWVVTFIIAQVFLLSKIIIRIVYLHSCFNLYLGLQKRKEE